MTRAPHDDRKIIANTNVFVLIGSHSVEHQNAWLPVQHVDISTKVWAEVL